MNPLLVALVAAGVITQDEADTVIVSMQDGADGDDALPFGEYEITEQDIRIAIKAWDELMPEYRGLLAAEVVNDSAAGDEQDDAGEDGE